MRWKSKNTRILIATSMLILLSSCANVVYIASDSGTSLNIKPPDPDVQSLLILPFRASNYTDAPFDAYYSYEITKKDDPDRIYQVIFKPSMDGNMLVVDSLATGVYYLKGVTAHSMKGSTTLAINYDHVIFEKFKLESGKITIFHQAILMTIAPDVRNEGYQLVGFRMWPTSIDLKNKIMVQLMEMENFDEWEVLIR